MAGVQETGLAAGDEYDPLLYLPCSTIVEYGKGSHIYPKDRVCSQLHLVIDGTVAVSLVTSQGQRVIIDVYGKDEFFGEPAMVGSSPGLEAVALEKVKAMTWSVAEIDRLIIQKPQLGIALVRTLTKRTMTLVERLESCSRDNTDRRLAWALLRFTNRLGTRAEDGSIRMFPFTHEVLSAYVGTSREIVNLRMLEFRRKGYLNYSRREISLYPAAIERLARSGNSQVGERG